jgi:uncharacterized damage-inducible protein DinB
MNKMELILHGWDSAYDKEDWYPPLKDALQGVTWEQANWRPRTGGPINTIWQNVLHLIFYKERFLKRLTGEEAEYPEGVSNDDTFGGAGADEEAWQATLAKLEEVQLAIRDQLAGLKKKDFDRRIPKTPIGLWANSLILHDAYHTGQIILLRKLQKSWPARRSFE